MVALEALASPEVRRFVLLGDAGSGKTTFAHWVCQALARPGGGELPEGLAGLVPLRFVLREVVSQLSEVGPKRQAAVFWSALGTTLAEALDEVAARRVVAHLQEHLPARGAFVVFDGLDEVPETARPALFSAIESFVGLLEGGRSRFLVTARPYAYADPKWRLEGFEILALAPFTAEQAERFVSRWYQAVRAGFGWSREGAESRAEKLRRALAERPYLGDLATRPLLLTLMATVHSGEGQLPEGRADLYERSVKLLLDRWQRAREVEIAGRRVSEPSIAEVLGVGEAKLRAVLERLALEAHERQRGESAGQGEPASISREKLLRALEPLMGDVAPQKLINYLRDRAGLLVERRAGEEYAFPHRSFQEFLAASGLLQLPGPEAELRRRLDEDPRWWREAALLGLGKMKLGGLGQAVGALNTLLPAEPQKGDLRDETRLRTAVVVGLAAEELGLTAIGDDVYKVIVDRVKAWFLKIVERGLLPPKERLEAGDLLGRLGDERKGVGVRVTRQGRKLPDVDWVEIPAGPFTMGSKDDDEQAWDDEKPQHVVELDRFWIGRYPVTNAQFAPFIEDGGYDRRELWTEAGWEWRQGAEVDVSPYPEDLREQATEWFAGRPKEKRGRPFFWDHPRLSAHSRPVVGITWFEALAYARWLTEVAAEIGMPAGAAGAVAGLPSEAQWERAARGTDGKIWPWRGKANPGTCNTSEGELSEPSTVGMFPCGKSPEGLYDCSGNVWEWTSTIWSRSDFMKTDHRYPYRSDDGREEIESKDLRVTRGGSYYNDLRYARCAARSRGVPGFFSDGCGFRVVLSLANSLY